MVDIREIMLCLKEQISDIYDMNIDNLRESYVDYPDSPLVDSEA